MSVATDEKTLKSRRASDQEIVFSEILADDRLRLIYQRCRSQEYKNFVQISSFSVTGTEMVNNFHISA
jgi:hypothetical protein